MLNRPTTKDKLQAAYILAQSNVQQLYTLHKQAVESKDYPDERAKRHALLTEPKALWQARNDLEQAADQLVDYTLNDLEQITTKAQRAAEFMILTQKSAQQLKAQGMMKVYDGLLDLGLRL